MLDSPSKDKLVRLSALLLTSLAATETGETREGIAYAGMMGFPCDFGEFQATLGFLCDVNPPWVVRGESHKLTITQRGRDIATKIEAAMAAARAKAGK